MKMSLNVYLQVQEARNNHDDEAVKKAVNEYDEALERYLIFIDKIYYKPNILL